VLLVESFWRRGFLVKRLLVDQKLRRYTSIVKTMLPSVTEIDTVIELCVIVDDSMKTKGRHAEIPLAEPV
jgi:hypothetical protein